jgi:hypothetical protein
VINLPAAELADMLKTLSDAAEDVAKRKPAVESAYRIVKDAARRTQ